MYISGVLAVVSESVKIKPVFSVFQGFSNLGLCGECEHLGTFKACSIILHYEHKKNSLSRATWFTSN